MSDDVQAPAENFRSDSPSTKADKREPFFQWIDLLVLELDNLMILRHGPKVKMIPANHVVGRNQSGVRAVINFMLMKHEHTFKALAVMIDEAKAKDKKIADEYASLKGLRNYFKRRRLLEKAIDSSAEVRGMEAIFNAAKMLAPPKPNS